MHFIGIRGYRLNINTLIHSSELQVKAFNQNQSYAKKTENQNVTISNDSVEISSESQALYTRAAKVKSEDAKLLDKAKAVLDIVSDFIPGVGTAKDIFNLYKTIINPDSTITDIGLAVADLVPGPSIRNLKKFAAQLSSTFNLNANSKNKLNSSLAKAQAKSLKAMTKLEVQTLIRQSESTAIGHAKEKHLDITIDQLKLRSKKEGIPATKFTNGDTMKNFIKKFINTEANAIANWVASSSKTDFVRVIDSSSPIGYGYQYNSTTKKYNEYYNIKKGVIVLSKSSNAELGFIIKTAYPKAK